MALANRELVTLVAQEGADVRGFCALEGAPGSDGAAEIRARYVEPASWRAGVGSALLAVALELLRERGVAAVTLWVFEGNSGARVFYERHGFAPDGASMRYAGSVAIGAPPLERHMRAAL